MANEVRIEIRVDEHGYVNFSIEKDGEKRSAGFGGGCSHYIAGMGGTGGMGILSNVRALAAEVRASLYQGAAILDLDAQEGKRHAT